MMRAFRRVAIFFSYKQMFKRPSGREEGVCFLRQALLRTSQYKNHPSYSILWNSVDFMINGTWEKEMLTRLCQCSEITCFLFNTACPVVEEMLCSPEQWDANIMQALKDENAPGYVKEVYTLLEDMRNAALLAVSRTDIDDDIRICAEETLKLFDSPHFCECIRCVALTSLKGRICLRIGLPRMTHTLKNDTMLQSEKMSVDIMKDLW